MKNLFDLYGKVALITGSSSGMGKAIAQALGEFGAKIIVSSHEKDALEQTVEDFQKLQIETLGIFCNMTKKEDIDDLINHSMQHFGKIDILVNCVGLAMDGSFMDINAENFDKTMHLNLESAIYLSQKLIPQMQERKDGSIIFLASIAGVRGNLKLGLYGVSKAGLISLAKSMAVEYGPDNIRVNTISPGLINTPFSASLMQNQEFMQKRLLKTPLRRVGEVEEIAGVALMLASKAGAFITGQNIIVDGGTVVSD